MEYEILQQCEGFIALVETLAILVTIRSDWMNACAI